MQLSGEKVRQALRIENSKGEFVEMGYGRQRD